MTESELERELHRRGQELMRRLLQGHLDQRTPEEAAGPAEGGRRCRALAAAPAGTPPGDDLRDGGGCAPGWVALVDGAETQLDLASAAVDLRTVIDIKSPTSSRDELVVPVAVKLIGNQRDGVHLRLGHRHAGRVQTGVEFRLYLKPGLGSCVADAVDDGLVGRQRGAPPVRRDVAEESVLDLVPLARAGGEMTHVNGQAGLVRQLL